MWTLQMHFYLNVHAAPFLTLAVSAWPVSKGLSSVIAISCISAVMASFPAGQKTQ